MAQKEISRQEALATLDRGDIITVAVKVKRPIQIGMKDMEDDGHYSPIFLDSLEWVEEPNRVRDSIARRAADGRSCPQGC